jgi:hypothetical protein
LLVASQALSWSTGVILMGVMSFKFIQWYRAKKNLLVAISCLLSDVLWHVGSNNHTTNFDNNTIILLLREFAFY